MQSFCFIILHIPGRVNRVADFLSRSGAQLAFLNIFFALSGMANLSEDFWRGTGSAAELEVVPTSPRCALPAPESDLSEVFSEKSSGLAKSAILVIFDENAKNEENGFGPNIFIPVKKSAQSQLDLCNRVQQSIQQGGPDAGYDLLSKRAETCENVKTEKNVLGPKNFIPAKKSVLSQEIVHNIPLLKVFQHEPGAGYDLLSKRTETWDRSISDPNMSPLEKLKLPK